MSAILKLVQGTPEWRAHRAKSRNASETPAVMGVSPWQTPYQLWLLRTGRSEQKVNAAMQRGTQLEAAARAAYEQLTALVLEPLVLEDGEYSASLDGMTLEGDLILEVKCPWKGRDSDLWKAVAAGDMPVHYQWQVEHQLMVSSARTAHLWVFDGTQGILLEATARPETRPEIRAAWDRFIKYIDTDSPPPLSARDTRQRTDSQWQVAAEAYIAAKRAADVAERTLDEAKAELVALASHPSESGAGVTVSRFWKAGAVDYKKIPVLRGVNLEQYRGRTREEVRVIVK